MHGSTAELTGGISAKNLYLFTERCCSATSSCFGRLPGAPGLRTRFTSPRREASLFDLPGPRGPAFFWADRPCGGTPDRSVLFRRDDKAALARRASTIPAGLQNYHPCRRRRARQHRRQQIRPRHLAATRKLHAIRIDDTVMSLFQGNVQTDILFHGHAPSWPIGTAQHRPRIIGSERDQPRLWPCPRNSEIR